MTKNILFIENYPMVMTYKMSKVLQERGYETTLISLSKQDKRESDFFRKGFNNTFSFNLTKSDMSIKKPKQLLSSLYNSLKLIIKIRRRVKPYIIIGRANPNLPLLFFKKLYSVPFIYFPYDIHVLWCPTKEYAKKVRGLSGLEIFAEKYLFKKSEGLIHKGSPYELDHINGRMLGDNVVLPKHIISFLPYCSKEFMLPFSDDKLSKKDNEFHLVTTTSEGKMNYDTMFTRLEEVKDLILQKIHLHIYTLSNTPSEIFSKDEFYEKYKDYPCINYFHIHDSLDPKSIVKEIRKYDLGCMPYFEKYDENDVQYKYCTGNKYSTFFESGIAFLYPEDNEFCDEIMAFYGLDLSYPKDIKELKSFLESLDFEDIKKGVTLAREDFLMEKQIDKLINLIELVKTEN